MGIEPPHYSSTNTAILDQGGAESGVVAQIDPELHAVIEAWEQLPDAIKAGILAMVRSAGG